MSEPKKEEVKSIPLSIEKNMRAVRIELDNCTGYYEVMANTLQDLNNQLIKEKSLVTRLKALLTPEQIENLDKPEKLPV